MSVVIYQQLLVIYQQLFINYVDDFLYDLNTVVERIKPQVYSSEWRLVQREVELSNGPTSELPVSNQF